MTNDRRPVVSGTFGRLLEAGMSKEDIRGQYREVFEGGQEMTDAQIAVAVKGAAGGAVDKLGVPAIMGGGFAGILGSLGPTWTGLLGAAAAAAGLGGLWATLTGGPGGETSTEMTTTGGGAMVTGSGHNMVVGGVYVNGSPLGIGVPEPPRAMVAKQWKTKAFSYTVGEYWVYFFKLIDGRIMCWNEAKGEWKMWRPKKPIVLYRGKITLSQAVRTQRMLDKLWRTVAKKTKALKLS